MATSAGSLTAVAIRNAKAGEKPYRLFDGGGLYLEVMPTGSRYWRLKYRYAGKEKRLALGVFPEVGLAEARGLRDTARGLCAPAGILGLKRRRPRFALSSMLRLSDAAFAGLCPLSLRCLQQKKTPGCNPEPHIRSRTREHRH